MRSKVDRAENGGVRASSRRETPRRSPDPGTWEQLQHEIESCTQCPLHATRTQVVVYRGSRTPRLLLIGEAPGAEEDRTGVPFVGRSGRRLDAALASLGLSTDDYGILNLIKCRPPENRFDRSAARSCRPYLERQLRLLNPSALVTLGAHALASIDPTAPRILECAGRPRRVPGWELFPLIHPAAALRSTRMAQRWTEDIQHLGSWIPTLGTGAAREPL